MDAQSLTELQLSVMQALWRLEEGSVAEVRASLQEDGRSLEVHMKTVYRCPIHRVGRGVRTAFIAGRARLAAALASSAQSTPGGRCADHAAISEAMPAHQTSTPHTSFRVLLSSVTSGAQAIVCASMPIGAYLSGRKTSVVCSCSGTRGTRSMYWKNRGKSRSSSPLAGNQPA